MSSGGRDSDVDTTLLSCLEGSFTRYRKSKGKGKIQGKGDLCHPSCIGTDSNVTFDTTFQSTVKGKGKFKGQGKFKGMSKGCATEWQYG